MRSKKILTRWAKLFLVLMVGIIAIGPAGAQVQRKEQTIKPGVRPQQPLKPLKSQKDLTLPQVRLDQRLDMSYQVYRDVVSSDFKTIFVLSPHFIARWDRLKRRETRRLPLKPYSHQTDTHVRLELDAQGKRLYVALDQTNKVSADAPDRPQFQLIILEINAQTLKVTREMPFGAFDATGSTAHPEKVWELILSNDGKAAYVFGNYPKVGDSGTVGSVAWSDLVAWKHGDIQYIQDIVEQSHVRAAQDAARWTFTYPQPILIPGTNRIFIARHSRGGGLLEAGVSPRTGMRPIQTLAGLEKCVPIGEMDGRLYYYEGGNLRSLPLNRLDGESTFHFPDAGQMQFSKSDIILSAHDKKILVGGNEGVWVYDLTQSRMKRYDQFSRKTLGSAWVQKLHVGRGGGQVLIRLSRQVSPPGPGPIDTKASYILFGY